MIKKIITNDYVYDGNDKDFLSDTYTRHYKIKTYFLGILIWNREMVENVKRNEKEINKSKIGF